MIFVLKPSNVRKTNWEISAMTNRLAMILSGLLCVGGLVAGQDVKYNFDSTVNFAKYHTYQWVSLPTSHPDQLVDRQIKQDINAQLAAKGLTQVTANADIQVGYQISIDQEKQWDAWGGPGLRFGGMATATSSTIDVGTLGIDFVDPTTKLLVWRGEGTKTLDPSGNAQKNQERMQKSIAKILKNFPPRKK
jgi:hypothetical protein